MRCIHQRAFIGLAVFLAVAVPPDKAAAQGAEAEQLFRLGQRLMKEGRFDEACAAFKKSHGTDRNVNALANLADCYDKSGKIASAWRSFVELAEATRDASEHAALNSLANERASKLEPRLSFLTLMLEGGLAKTPGLEILIDDEPVPQSFWSAPFAVDGGARLITARAAGYEPFTRTIELSDERDRQTLALPELRAIAGNREANAAPDDPWKDLMGSASAARATHTEKLQFRYRNRWYGGVLFGGEDMSTEAAGAYFYGLEVGRHSRVSRVGFFRWSAVLKFQQNDDEHFGLDASARLGAGLLDGSVLLSMGPTVGVSTGASGGRDGAAQFGAAWWLVNAEIAYVFNGQYEAAASLALDDPLFEGAFKMLAAVRYHRR